MNGLGGCLEVEWVVLAHEYKALYYNPPPVLYCWTERIVGEQSSDGMNATCQRKQDSASVEERIRHRVLVIRR